MNAKCDKRLLIPYICKTIIFFAYSFLLVSLIYYKSCGILDWKQVEMMIGNGKNDIRLISIIISIVTVTFMMRVRIKNNFLYSKEIIETFILTLTILLHVAGIIKTTFCLHVEFVICVSILSVNLIAILFGRRLT